jgi:hypothetical protein
MVAGNAMISRNAKMLQVLCKGYGDAHIRNLNALKRKGVSALISGKPLWYSKPRAHRKQKELMMSKSIKPLKLVHDPERSPK